MGLIALTKIQQRMFLDDERADIVVNAVCPGYVKTDMTAHKGYLTTEQGIQNIFFFHLNRIIQLNKTFIIRC